MARPGKQHANADGLSRPVEAMVIEVLDEIKLIENSFVIGQQDVIRNNVRNEKIDIYEPYDDKDLLYFLKENKHRITPKFAQQS